MSADIQGPDEREIAAIFERLRAEVSASAPAGEPAGGPRAGQPLRARNDGERYWPVTAERGLASRPGPVGSALLFVKRLLRPFLRWYVEPPLVDQRQFNLATLSMLDELAARVGELERRRSDPSGPESP